MSKKRIGIFGGTFDPIHIGHLINAQMAQSQIKLDKVIFIPVYSPPHKRWKTKATALHRLNMVKLAIKDNPCFEASDCEIKRKGKSYTIDTIKYLKKKLSKDDDLFFIIGRDAVSQLSTWNNIEELYELITFIVVNRPNYSENIDARKFKSVIMPDIDISSVWIRRRLALGKTIKYFVPDRVILYVKRHNLYK